ncbi:MAG: FKBP-type peptidyl-prolyl cis-trans isomerase [Pseudomonadota bacterium]|jgi:FKBP-type peptidyl-prolyl cis-trans isomerase FkpA|nr:FKBP-type peptidyl-prolyl cis-trans isomerase [Pseudomonadota bacterium]
MSTVTAVPLQPIKRGSVAKLWLGIALLVAAALLLAWAGAGRMVGVAVKTVLAGKGPVIGPNDGVIIEYTGRLPDGKIFDSTEGRGPAPLLVGQVVPGFSSALQRMQSGGRYQVHIPSKLAYGATQPPGSPIPPNSDLDFDIHVVQVVPNAALMAAAQQGGAPQPR